MKNNIQILAVLVITSFLFSCSSDDDLNYQSDFIDSQNAWLHFKELSNNSYKYVVSGGSVFTTYGWETAITVSNGKIIQRQFAFTGNPQNIPDGELEWIENEKEINSHTASNAAEALTLDQIYSIAEKEWLIKRKNTTSYFKSKNDGLISTCGYVKNECMDDCFFGITIKSIEIL